MDSGYAFACMAGLLLSALLLHLAKRPRAEHLAAMTACLADFAWLAGLARNSGRLPVYQGFEILSGAALILCVMGLFALPGNFSRSAGVRPWVWLQGSLLLAIAALLPRGPTFTRYDQAEIFVALFHVLRVASLAAALFSAAWFSQYGWQRVRMGAGKDLPRLGRNYLLCAIVLFLGSEYAGILWCLQGWGDVWRWSKGFLQSTLVLLFLTAFFHVPGKNEAANGARALFGGLAGFFMIAVQLLRTFG